MVGARSGTAWISFAVACVCGFVSGVIVVSRNESNHGWAEVSWISRFCPGMACFSLDHFDLLCVEVIGQ